MRKTSNTEHIEGYLYQHDLSIKQVSNEQSPNYGKNYIAGTVEISVDEEGFNIIPIHYTYVTETTKSGGENRTYTALKQIIDNGKTWVADGKELAFMVKADTTFALNEFFQNEDLISIKRNEGGFLSIVSHISNELRARHTFDLDLFIQKVVHIDENQETGTTEHDSVRGFAFNFKNEILPAEFIVRYKPAMDWFEGLDLSQPIFTRVRGEINNNSISVMKESTSAWGETIVDKIERKVKEWEITWVNGDFYDFSEDSSDLKPSELQEAMQNREVKLAEIKKRAEDYKNSKAVAASAPAGPTATNIYGNTSIPTQAFKYF